MRKGWLKSGENQVTTNLQVLFMSEYKEIVWALCLPGILHA